MHGIHDCIFERMCYHVCFYIDIVVVKYTYQDFKQDCWSARPKLNESFQALVFPFIKLLLLSLFLSSKFKSILLILWILFISFKYIDECSSLRPPDKKNIPGIDEGTVRFNVRSVNAAISSLVTYRYWYNCKHDIYTWHTYIHDIHDIHKYIHT